MKKLLVLFMSLAVMICTLVALTSCAAAGSVILVYNDNTRGTEVDTAIEADVEKVLPTDAVKTGYTFTGWYTDKACTQKVESITPKDGEHYVVYAGWRANAGTLTLVDNADDAEEGGTPATAFDAALTVGEEKVLPTLTNKYDGVFDYAFSGWYTDAALTNKITSIVPAIETNYTVYAGWVSYQDLEHVGSINGDFEVTYTNEYSSQYAPGVVAPVLGIPERNDGYEFRGWYLDLDLTIEATQEVLAKNIGYTIVYAKWEYPVEITYDAVGGSIAGSANIDYTLNYDLGKIPAVVLPTPTKNELKFLGWYFDEDYEQRATADAVYALKQNNITLYARWADTINVTYMNGDAAAVLDGTEGTDYTVTFKAGSAPKLPSVTVGTETWNKWYFDAEFTKPADKNTLKLVNSDVTLYLRTEKIYTIVYNLDGATIPTGTEYDKTWNPADYTSEDGIALPMVTKDGYVFLGWYLDAEFTTPATYAEIYKIGSDAFLYPRLVDDGYFGADIVAADKDPKVNSNTSYFSGVNLTEELKSTGSNKFTFHLETADTDNVEWDSTSYSSGFRILPSATTRVDEDGDGKFDNYSQPMRFIIFKKEQVDNPDYGTVQDAPEKIDRYGMYAGSHEAATHTFLTEMNSGATIDVVFDMVKPEISYYVNGELVVTKDMNTLLPANFYSEGQIDINHLNYEGAGGTQYTYDNTVYTRSNRNYMIQLEASGARAIARRTIGIYAYDIFEKVDEGYNVTPGPDFDPGNLSGMPNPDVSTAVMYETDFQIQNDNTKIGDLSTKLDADNPFISVRIDTKKDGEKLIGGTGASNGRMKIKIGDYTKELLRLESNGSGGYNVRVYSTGQQADSWVVLAPLADGAVIDIIIDIKGNQIMYYVNGFLKHTESGANTGDPDGATIVDALPTDLTAYNFTDNSLFAHRTNYADNYITTDEFAVYAYNIYAKPGDDTPSGPDTNPAPIIKETDHELFTSSTTGINVGAALDADKPFITVHIDTAEAGANLIGRTGEAANGYLQFRTGVTSTSAATQTQIEVLRFKQSGSDYQLLTHNNGTLLGMLSAGKAIDLVFDIAGNKIVYYVDGVLTYTRSDVGLPTDLELYDYTLAEGETKEVGGVTYTGAKVNVFLPQRYEDNFITTDEFAIYPYNIHDTGDGGIPQPDDADAVVVDTDVQVGNDTAKQVGNLADKLDADNPFITIRVDLAEDGAKLIGATGAKNAQWHLKLGATKEGVAQLDASVHLLRFNLIEGTTDYNVLSKQSGTQLCLLSEGKLIDIVIDIKGGSISYYVDGVLTATETHAGLDQDLQCYDYSLAKDATKEVGGVTYTGTGYGLFVNREDPDCSNNYITADVFAVYAFDIYA